MHIKFNQHGLIYFEGKVSFTQREFGLHFFIGSHSWNNWQFSIPKTYNHREIDIDVGPLMRLHVFHKDDA